MLKIHFNFKPLLICFATFIFVSFLFSFFTSPALSANGINRFINFQGKLVNNPAGTNVSNTTYTVIFTIYDKSSGGTALWTETQTVTTADGIFRVALGSVTSIPTNFNFNWSDLYLGMKVNSDAEMTPRVQLAAVPYAFNSQQVAGLTVQDTSGNASTSGTLQIPNAKTINLGTQNLTLTTSGDTTLTLPTSGTLATLAGSEILTNKTIGSTGITFSGATTDVTTAANEDLVISPNGSGKVGLNTSSPLSTLDIRGNFGSGTLAIASVSGSTSFSTLISNNNLVAGDLFSASSSSQSRFTIKGNGSIIANAYQTCTLKTDSNGLVTCGTDNTGGGGGNSPFSEISGGIIVPNNLTEDFILGSQSSASARFRVTGNIFGAGTLSIASVSGRTSYGALIVNNDGVGDLFAASASGTNRFVINNQGRVGINVNKPLHALELAADTTGSGGIGFGNDVQIYRTGTSILALDGNGAGNATLNITGNFNSTLQSSIGVTNKINLKGDASANGEQPAGNTITGTGSTATNIQGGDGSVGGQVVVSYFDGTIERSALEVANVASGFSKLLLMRSGGTVGIGTGANSNNPLATLDVRGNSGTTPVATFSGRTSYAALIVNNDGVGDLFTASSSSQTKFVISQNGSIDSTGLASISGSLTFKQGTASIQSTSFNTLTLGGASTGQLVLSGFNGAVNAISMTGYNTCTLKTTSTGVITCGTDNTGGGGGSSPFSELAGAIVPNNSTEDFLIGGQSTASALFRVTGKSPFAGTTSVASIAAQTSFAALVVDNQSSFGDLFTASASGATRFVVTNQGNVGIGTKLPTSKLHVKGGAKFESDDTVDATADTIITKGSGSTSGVGWNSSVIGHNISSTLNGSNIPTINANAGSENGAVALQLGADANANSLFGIWVNSGAATTALNQVMGIKGDGRVAFNNSTSSYLSSLDIRPTLTSGSNGGTISIASVSGKTSFAALVVDQTGGSGDIFTASYAGATRFRIAQNGSTLFQGQTLASIGQLKAYGTATNIDNDFAVINALGDTGSLIPNPGFESAISRLSFADGWVTASTNSAAVTRDPTGAKGNSSAKVTSSGNNQSAAFYSACIPLSGPGNYTLSYFMKGSAINSMTVRAYVDQYTSQANCQSNTTPIISAIANSTALTASYANATSVTYTGATNQWSTTTTWGRVHFFAAASVTGMSVNIDGVRLIETTTAFGTDYAENYPANPDDIAEPGDIVSLDSGGEVAQVSRTKKYMDDSVIGIVSTEPGETIGSSVPEPRVAVALAGRVPVKVSTAKGFIKTGDYLASSNIPGVAVKAINAGPVIGVAMEDYSEHDPNTIGKVTTFIKNTYYNGKSLASDTGLTSDDGNNVLLKLSDRGSFMIKNASGAGAITFDPNGNAFFAGTITADKIKANSIEGLDVISSKIDSLSKKVDILETFFAKTNVLGSATESGEVNLSTASGALAINSSGVTGDLSIKGNTLISGMLTVLDSITAPHLIISDFASFFGDVVFNGQVRFEQTPTFSSDTAGFAVIKKGDTSVEVDFSQEYANTPVVTASISLGKDEQNIKQKQLEDSILNGNMSYIITQRSSKGFVIRLNSKADSDITFSWVALYINNIKTSQSGTSGLAVSVSATKSAAFQSILNQLNSGN